MLNALRERVTDYLRERRIRALRLAVQAAYEVADKPLLHERAATLFAECDQRSEAQKRRMERAIVDRMDPHARAIYDRRGGA